jgi:hypothetical protein
VNIHRNAEFKFLPANRIVSGDVQQPSPASAQQQGSCFFLNSTKAFPFISNINSIDVLTGENATSLVVCWNNSNSLLFYPFGKINKGKSLTIYRSTPRHAFSDI